LELAATDDSKKIAGYISDQSRQILNLRSALEFVVNRKNLMFAECSDAEEIIARCETALKELT